ncbi:SMI1/KNR4 family protein [Aneurinibacillus danicus]|uniref:Knr4/Smi1-like domain-containing protein n=1 Tax=Aneurinibacillus danicus TaxID=267746 RepID=A0A511VH35_9BACL|nr:SMI1/KNR4 family protein [Aneurinibacillus danicus]GEN36863.1 hypothetical protein ADA01nite_43230 [Aneurinibacillus danicus]
MSLETYHQAKQTILNNKEKGFFVGPRPIELITLAEEKLGLKFTGSYLDFLKSFGAGNFGAQEIFGIINGDFENSSVPDAIWYTLTERKEIDLPHNLLVIYDTGSDEFYCLDFSQQDEHNEPPVVSFVPGIDNDKQQYEIIAKDFGDFLLNLVNQEI